MSFALFLLVAASVVVCCYGDTPANCSYVSVLGKWTFYIGEGGHDNSLDCEGSFNVLEELSVDLAYPDVATVQGDTDPGFWTMIFNQGFEVVVGQRKFFAFSNYTRLNDWSMEGVSHCSSTLNGWAHDVNGKDWACYYGVKKTKSKREDTSRFGGGEGLDKNSQAHEEATFEVLDLDKKYVKNLEFVEKLNAATSHWRATHYPQFEGLTVRERQLMAGGGKSLRHSIPMARQRRNADATKPELFPVHQREAWSLNLQPSELPSPVSFRKRLSVEELPKNFDWRDVGGVDYVPPVMEQLSCGSCYAIAAVNMFSSRFMIQSDGKIQKLFSPQDVVSCSEYSQGCEGGFPYLVGKYADDFGVVEEECFSYVGKDMACKEMGPGCQRYRATDYHYIGGYDGACSEELMQQELVNDGPIVVGYDVSGDFFQYSEGVYGHVQNVVDELNSWKPVNHAVLVVGYGETEDGYKYWVAQNSWGKHWGEEGYFRISRGTNEANFETIAVAAMAVL